MSYSSLVQDYTCQVNKGGNKNYVIPWNHLISFLAQNSHDALVTLAPKPVFAKWLGCMAILPTTLDAETTKRHSARPVFKCQNLTSIGAGYLWKHWGVGGSIFRRVSFYIVLAFGTQVVIWPNSGDCPQHLVLVRQNSSFWTSCKRSLKNWCWGWTKQACILPVCWLPCLLCLPTDFHVFIWWIWSGD